MVKEASASARTVSQPGERGAANTLIGEIVAEANSKDARHEMKEHRGPTPQAAIDGIIQSLQPAADALKKLPADEATHVGEWFVDIAVAVAKSAKSISAEEQTTIAKVATVFGVKAPEG
jgi:hypothetical protein